jgi:hypothetical protein
MCLGKAIWLLLLLGDGLLFIQTWIVAQGWHCASNLDVYNFVIVVIALLVYLFFEIWNKIIQYVSNFIISKDRVVEMSNFSYKRPHIIPQKQG